MHSELYLMSCITCAHQVELLISYTNVICYNYSVLVSWAKLFASVFSLHHFSSNQTPGCRNSHILFPPLLRQVFWYLLFFTENIKYIHYTWLLSATTNTLKNLLLYTVFIKSKLISHHPSTKIRVSYLCPLYLLNPTNNYVWTLILDFSNNSAVKIFILVCFLALNSPPPPQ